MPINQQPGPQKPAPPKEAAIAFAAVQSEIDALANSDLVTINVDIPRAVSIVLGAAPVIATYRERFLTELPQLPIDYVDRLPTYALAAWYAHLIALPMSSADNPVKTLSEEAAPLRENLLVAAEALAHRGVFDKDRIAEIRRGQGHVDTANDLVALSAVFAQNWAAIQSKTAVEWTEVERAAELGPALLVALGEREVPPSVRVDDPVKVRVRAFSLLMKVYDQCRRGMAYLVWGERELAEVAPSVHSNRQAPRKSTAGGEPAAPEPGGNPENP